jgi:hypothetical protein
MLYINGGKNYFTKTNEKGKIVEEMKEKLLLENKKILLNMMYVLKAIIVVFKNFLRTSYHL